VGREEETPIQTWHYGLVAAWWSEFNDASGPHEVAYFVRRIEEGGGPALDVACGTGRILMPCLRAGLDVDGCDVSADMVALCREKAARSGLSPTLFVQPMHELDPPRRYRTVIVCGAFGLGSTRDQDLEALRRFHDCLEPGGALLLDIEVPYADGKQWRYWLRDERRRLPEAAESPSERRRASDGSELALRSRIVDLDPLSQRATLEIHAERWRDGTLEVEEDRALTIGLYFPNELRLMLERAGFVDVRIEGDHNGLEPTREDDFVVLVATRPGGTTGGGRSRAAARSP
jgi:SAM-dependent methyltransferase